MSGKLIYVLIPFKSIDQFERLGNVLNNDKQFMDDGQDYIDAAHDNAPYLRIRSILVRAMKTMPEYGVPEHTTDHSERIYELRSYQGATEKLYEKKVEMFTDGGESKLFMDLGFQPIFFGEVISGPIMPNLMYLTTFKNETSQNEHWNAFRISPVWTELKADEQYANTVSKSEKFMLHPTDYSDL
ncbi:NIPSNAP family protein, partial [Bacteroidota bacterium]